jgi:hypothetical protein
MTALLPGMPLTAPALTSAATTCPHTRCGAPRRASCSHQAEDRSLSDPLDLLARVHGVPSWGLVSARHSPKFDAGTGFCGRPSHSGRPFLVWDCDGVEAMVSPRRDGYAPSPCAIASRSRHLCPAAHRPARGDGSVAGEVPLDGRLGSRPRSGLDLLRVGIDAHIVDLRRNSGLRTDIDNALAGAVCCLTRPHGYRESPHRSVCPVRAQ